MNFSLEESLIYLISGYSIANAISQGKLLAHLNFKVNLMKVS
jgi:hypothetical protein